MKTMKYINIIILLFNLSIYAQQTLPQIEFESTTIDYGIIENGSDGERAKVVTSTIDILFQFLYNLIKSMGSKPI